jgi:hypothetical protein
LQTIYDVPVLLRREIEALMIKPFLDAFENEIGHEKTYEIAAGVIQEIAKKQGADYAEMIGTNDLSAMLAQKNAWTANNALEGESDLKEGGILYLIIKRCDYVDMYSRIGMRDLGYTLSCMRDNYFYKGFNPDMIMTRSKTLMTDGDCCDFCFKPAQES